ncbi:MAG: hypothetical protein ABR614_12630 [Mycobacteriales bacterium]
MPTPSRRVRSLALLAAGALSVVPLVGLTSVSTSSAASGASAPAARLQCPPGTAETTKTPGQRAQERKAAGPAFEQLLTTVDAATADRATACRPVKQPEPFREVAAMATERDAITAGPRGYTPAGALRAALTAKTAATAAASTVPGAQGTFTPLGTTPLIADDPAAPNVNGLGLADQAGRIDSYAYDAVHKRLFSGPGTGGVWMSTNVGKSWQSIGDTLPYQSVGAVTWSPAGTAANGTLLVVSGEASAGGSVYVGMGGFYSTDLGKTWQQSSGIPDGLMGFEIEVDPTNPQVVYAATSQGLYRSADAGKTYRNVNLPTGRCAGKTGYKNDCQNGNWVTDVQIKAPGGVGKDKKGGQVLAAVGYRAGKRLYPGTDLPQSPANGLYRSDTGAVGSFKPLDVSGDGTTPIGFAPQERIGRTEFGAATGPAQDHDFVYAIVEDAVLFNDGVPGIDAFDDTEITGGVPNNTAFNGIYVSPDFGASWTRMADELELQTPLTESALIGASAAQLYQPGVQAWYNQWIEPDPTSATASGVPTRLVFGLEEVWESRLSGQPQDEREALNPSSFRVIGPYFADDTCGFLDNPLPYCPTQQTASGQTTTHPDQQSGIWIPAADGGVTLVVGNDGGTYRQDVAKGASLSKTKWGRGSQAGYNANTLLPYDAEPAKDGTVAFGLQDNGSGVVQPGGKVVETFGGDGFFAAIDPNDSKTYYNETTLADMRVTTDGGKTYDTITPPVSKPMFSNPFVMDPTDANHLLTAGPEVVETVKGPKTQPADDLSDGDWVQVFNLDTATDKGRQMTAVDLQGAAAYVGFCSTCDIINKDPKKGQIFASGLATNVGGSAAPKKASSAGWHFAAAKGLPDRYITWIAVDPANPKTVYVTLGGYANRQWWPVGAFNDRNPNVGEGHVFKSTNAGESFIDITGTVPDVPARSIEINRGQLLVGTDVGVFLSDTTSGTRWAALSGLPNVPVASIRTFPGNVNRVVLATFGRGIYSYTFSARSATTPTTTGTGGTAVPPSGTLPTTGLPASLAAGALLAMVGALLLRRRTA